MYYRISDIGEGLVEVYKNGFSVLISDISEVKDYISNNLKDGDIVRLYPIAGVVFSTTGKDILSGSVNISDILC